MGSTTEPEKGMGDRIWEVIERPTTPPEAAMHHDIKGLKNKVHHLMDEKADARIRLNSLEKRVNDLEALERTVTFLFDKSVIMAQRLDDLEAQKRPGDD